MLVYFNIILGVCKEIPMIIINGFIYDKMRFIFIGDGMREFGINIINILIIQHDKYTYIKRDFNNI